MTVPAELGQLSSVPETDRLSHKVLTLGRPRVGVHTQQPADSQAVDGAAPVHDDAAGTVHVDGRAALHAVVGHEQLGALSGVHIGVGRESGVPLANAVALRKTQHQRVLTLACLQAQEAPTG